MNTAAYEKLGHLTHGHKCPVCGIKVGQCRFMNYPGAPRFRASHTARLDLVVAHWLEKMPSGLTRWRENGMRAYLLSVPWVGRVKMTRLMQRVTESEDPELEYSRVVAELG